MSLVTTATGSPNSSSRNSWVSSVAYYKKKRGPLKEDFKISQEVKMELQNTEVWEEADHPKEISFYKFWFHF